MARQTKQKLARELAQNLGYSIQNIQGKSGYESRKCPVWGIFDRDGKMLASYSDWQDILKFLEKGNN